MPRRLARVVKGNQGDGQPHAVNKAVRDVATAGGEEGPRIVVLTAGHAHLIKEFPGLTSEQAKAFAHGIRAGLELAAQGYYLDEQLH